MGTDIHVVAQVRDSDGVWRDIDYDCDLENRNYTWFTFLCGERSEVTNKDRKLNIVPIDSPRGCPEDFETSYGDDRYSVDCSHGDKWMGYGVSSWVTLEEILEHEKHLPNPIYKEFPDIKRIGPIQELEQLFAGYKPCDCRIVFGFDS